MESKEERAKRLHRIRCRRYYRNHKEKILAKAATEEAKKKHREVNHRYYRRNKDKIIGNPQRRLWRNNYYLKHTERVALRNKAYRSTDAGKAARTREYRDPVKSKCNQRLNDAVRAGKIKRQPCEVCGATPSEGHHDDYTIWHKVRWLCGHHHREHHKLLSSSANLEGAKGGQFGTYELSERFNAGL